MSFEYDAAGRLTQIRDTLDQPTNPRIVTVSYNALGLISTLTDFTGRLVQYEYYNSGDAGGDVGDLKSVTSPVVVGTPTGNDFPSGKTVEYSYSTGFGDERLNHNLLTITDPKGQTFLVNEYASTLTASDLEFDRLVRQTWGNTGEVLDVHYAVDPGAHETRAVFNDRVGNVSECAYDGLHRLRVADEFTGRAIPNVPTTLTVNRPTGPVRAGDPPVYTTLFEYNADSLVTSVVFPNQNEHEYEYDSANSARRSQGNTLLWRQLPGPLGGDQAQIEHIYAYDPQFNFVTVHTDGRTNDWRYAYDTAGNLTQITYPDLFVEDLEYNTFGQVTRRVLPSNGSNRRDDTYTYYGTADATQNGFLKESILDAPGQALTTTYEYDALGNITRVVDPKLQDSLFTYNALDQVVQYDSRAVSLPAGPVRYQHRFYYDENDNVVRRCVLDVDEQGLTNPLDQYITSIFEYDILNFVTRSCQESGSHAVPLAPLQLNCTGLPDSEFITNEYTYDANRNMALRVSGEASEGREPTNTVTTVYDERDLVFQSIRAASDASQSTIQFDYDSNTNVQARREGLESVPRVSTYTYDGYDRLVLFGGATGNTATYSYDPNNNIVLSRIDGELDDGAGSAGNIRLAETRFVYDAENRLTLFGDSFFDLTTQAPLGGDGESTVQYAYNDNSQLITETDDNGHVTTTTYDAINRVSTVTNDLTDTISIAYDANSNILTVTEDDRSDLGSANQAFVTNYTYDAVDRVTRTTDSSGNVTEAQHDSRNNTRLIIDPLLHQTRYDYDAINRLITTTRDMNGTGANPAEPADIVIAATWDDNSRRATRVDDNGNTTSYAYDALNRMTLQTFADTTTTTYEYDVHDNLVTRIDENGSVIAGTFDLLNRRTGNTISPGVGVSNDTTFELFRYDGINRLVRAEDDDSVVTYTYDSLNNLTREVLTISPSGLLSTNGTSTFEYDAVGNRISTTYPSGRQITTTYDDLDRRKAITDTTGAPATVATYHYVGPTRVERRDYGNNTQCQFEYDGILGVTNPPGDSGVRQIIRTAHVDPVGTPLDERLYVWDSLYNKRTRQNISPATPGAPNPVTHEYDYDPMYRLTRTVVTEALVPPPPPLRVTDYILDGVGNRQRVLNDNCAGPYNLDPASPPADFQMNQYSATGCDNRTYDENGNLRDISNPALGPVKILAFNYRNELTEFQDLLTGTVATYTYDAMGRRIAKAVGAGPGLTETRFFYDGVHCMEEQDGAGNQQATYVYGRDVDEVLQMRRGATDFYFHGDDLGNVMAITDGTGSIVEQYEYQDYGQPEFHAPGGPPITESQIGNPYLFTGRRYDNESGLYYYRARYLDPVSGRFIQRDPLGNWGDSVNLGNASTYAANNPWTFTDPSGLGGGDPLKGLNVGHICGLKDPSKCKTRGAMGGGGSGGNINSDPGKGIVSPGFHGGGRPGGGHVPAPELTWPDVPTEDTMAANPSEGLAKFFRIVGKAIIGGGGVNPIPRGIEHEDIGYTGGGQGGGHGVPAPDMTWPDVPTEDTTAASKGTVHKKRPPDRTRPDVPMEHTLAGSGRVPKPRGIEHEDIGGGDDLEVDHAKRMFNGAALVSESRESGDSRVKVRYPWLMGRTDRDTSSCWIRVSQFSAGAGRGIFTLPEVDDEVLVVFHGGGSVRGKKLYVGGLSWGHAGGGGGGPSTIGIPIPYPNIGTVKNASDIKIKLP